MVLKAQARRAGETKRRLAMMRNKREEDVILTINQREKTLLAMKEAVREGKHRSVAQSHDISNLTDPSNDENDKLEMKDKSNINSFTQKNHSDNKPVNLLPMEKKHKGKEKSALKLFIQDDIDVSFLIDMKYPIIC